jgi:hypothetical protein
LPRLPSASCLPVVILVPATYHVSYLINFSRIVLALFYGWGYPISLRFCPPFFHRHTKSEPSVAILLFIVGLFFM